MKKTGLFLLGSDCKIQKCPVPSCTTIKNQSMLPGLVLPDMLWIAPKLAVLLLRNTRFGSRWWLPLWLSSALQTWMLFQLKREPEMNSLFSPLLSSFLLNLGWLWQWWGPFDWLAGWLTSQAATVRGFLSPLRPPLHPPPSMDHWWMLKCWRSKREVRMEKKE